MSTQLKNVRAIFIGTALTLMSYVVAILLKWTTVEDISLLEFFAVLTSYICTILCVWQSRTNYIWGAITVALYSWLFYKQGLYSSAILNVYLFPTLLWGWFRWKADADPRPVTFVQLKWVPVYLMLTGSVWYVLSDVATKMNATLPGPDSFILAASILAQFLLDQKKLENWIVWAVVNVFSIYTYETAGLHIVAIQYVLFLANTCYGGYSWWKTMGENK